MKLHVRYFTHRRRGDRIYYFWQPSGSLRTAGWKLQRLSDDRDEALLQAERFNAEVDRWRRGGRRPLGPPEGTLSALIWRYCHDDAFASLADATRREYAKRLRIIEDTFGDLPVKAITRQVVLEYKNQFADRPYWGNSIIKMLRNLLGYAVDFGLIEINPAARPRQFKTHPRRQIWTHDQERTFMAKAYEMGKPSLALGFALGVYTAQREADIVKLPWSRYDGDWFHRVRQQKTQRLLDVPVLSPLRAMIEATPRTGTVILLTETGRAYNIAYFRKLFRQVVLACGFDGLQFRDLRRTAVVRMGEAGLEIPLIASITGHDIDSTSRIMETYLPRNRTMAARAAKEMEVYYAELNR